MTEWHFYVAGTSKENPTKLWIIGANYEKNLIHQKIDAALNWQHRTPDSEQVLFADFMTCQLDGEKIPFVINGGTKLEGRPPLMM